MGFSDIAGDATQDAFVDHNGVMTDLGTLGGGSVGRALIAATKWWAIPKRPASVDMRSSAAMASCSISTVLSIRRLRHVIGVSLSNDSREYQRTGSRWAPPAEMVREMKESRDGSRPGSTNQFAPTGVPAW